jgi:hypothetical protein
MLTLLIACNGGQATEEDETSTGDGDGDGDPGDGDGDPGDGDGDPGDGDGDPGDGDGDPGDGDGDPGDGDGDPGDGDGDPGDGDGDLEGCPLGEEWVEPGCAPPFNPDPFTDFEAGCHTLCDPDNINSCTVGTCQAVWYENVCPCPPWADACCEACGGGETWICLP